LQESTITQEDGVVTKGRIYPPAAGHAPGSSDAPNKPAGVYLIALFFTALWLFSAGSLIYVLFFKFTPEMRRQLSFTPALASLALADLNLLLTVVASWLLVAMRRIGAGLLLASTVLVAGVCAISWPALIPIYLRHPSGALLRPLLMGSGNLLLHIAATAYAFRLNSKGLLR
jgi:drug/metabolite transporter (DMT)-like permease